MDAAARLPPTPLPGGVDVSAYRIVQEALTNALKHADGAARLTVDDRGGRAADPVRQPRSAGHAAPARDSGWPGMAERVALLGGTLEHGRTR